MKIKTDSNYFYFLVLLVLSAMIHFYSFGKPEQVVFDEVHFGKYVSAYCCNSQRIFDIHPPHAKILIAYSAKLLGYKGNQDFSKISTPFSKADSRALRFFPSLMGTILVPIIFILMLQLNASNAAAFFTASLILLDTALLTQSRFIFLDSLLLTSLFASISLFIWAKQRPRLSSRLVYFIFAGALAAVAVGTKFTGLAVLAMVFFYALKHLLNNRSLREINHWLLIAVAFMFGFVVIYLAGWQIHFSQLDQPGPGDVWGTLKGSFWDKLQQIHITMFKANANLTTPHHDASMWWSWPFMHKPIYYWNGLGSKIYLIGNPLVWWASIIFMLSAWVTLLLMRVSQLGIIRQESISQESASLKTVEKINKKTKKSATNNKLQPMLWFPFLGYFVSFLPLVLVSRPLFLYHYFTPLVFSLMFVVLWLDKIAWFRNGSLLQQRLSVYLYLLASIVCFGLMSPLSYGLTTSIAISDVIFNLLPSWR